MEKGGKVTTALPNKDVPWTNCRMVLSDDCFNNLESGAFPEEGVVARLYYSTNSHPAVRQSFHSLNKSKISLPALALHNLVNKRGPDGLVGCIPGETRHSSKLLALCQDCYDNGDVLVCSIPMADVVLVPRIPASAERDSVYFIAYATNIKAVNLCESLRSERRVAVVLDIDNTLIDATAVTLTEQDWDSLGWRVTTVIASTGRSVPGQYAYLPGSEDDPYADGSWIIHWRFGRVNCTFKVRVRRGWAAYREWLVAQKHRFATYVCSKGKAEYIQLIWHFLDPRGELIPKEQWPHRINSTFPDVLPRAANKTMLTAMGCAAITQPQQPTQLAAPVCLIDDSVEAYNVDYEDSLLYVEEYRPSDLVHSDQGSVLRQVGQRLEAYWQATCTENGTFAWQAAQSFATAILGATQRNPMESPDALQYLQGRCARQGELLGSQIKLRSVFGEQGVYVADEEQDDVRTTISIGSPREDLSIASSAMSSRHGSGLSAEQMLSLQSAASFNVPMPQASTTTAAVVEQGGISADDAITAAMMMRC